MTTPQVINATVTRTTPTFTVDGAPASPVIAPGTMPNIEGIAGHGPATQDTKGYLALTDAVFGPLAGAIWSLFSALGGKADLSITSALEIRMTAAEDRLDALENP